MVKYESENSSRGKGKFAHVNLIVRGILTTGSLRAEIVLVRAGDHKLG